MWTAPPGVVICQQSLWTLYSNSSVNQERLEIRDLFCSKFWVLQRAFQSSGREDVGLTVANRLALRVLNKLLNTVGRYLQVSWEGVDEWRVPRKGLLEEVALDRTIGSKSDQRALLVEAWLWTEAWRPKSKAQEGTNLYLLSFWGLSFLTT